MFDIMKHTRIMSGHSKWSQIKRKKGLADTTRGNLFSKISRVITSTVGEGGGITDPLHNAKLRLAIMQARQARMPKENITRAIERVSGKGVIMKEVVYEGFAPHGVALIIVATTDNSTRTASIIRSALEKYGGNLAPSGSIMYLFKKCGTAVFDKPNTKEEEVFTFAQAIGAHDMEEHAQSYIVYFPFEKIGHVGEHLGKLSPSSVAVDYRPSATIRIEGKTSALRLVELIESLEEFDDIYKVYANCDIRDEYV